MHHVCDVNWHSIIGVQCFSQKHFKRQGAFLSLVSAPTWMVSAISYMYTLNSGLVGVWH